MSSVVIAGDTSGTVTISAPAVAGTPTLTLPTTTGNIPVVTGTGTSGQVLTSGGSGAVSTWTTISAGATTLKAVTDTTDITLPLISSSYATVGSSFSVSIPTNGTIKLSSFAGRILWSSVADQICSTFGIRIGTTNYWFSKASSNGSINYTGMISSGTGAGYYDEYYGTMIRANALGSGYGQIGMAFQMDIAANSIPTGTQTVQAIAACGAAGYTGIGILKGTTTTTRVNIEFVSAS